MNKANKIDADANTLGIFSFSDLPNLRFLLQVFAGEQDKSRVLVLVDGDKGGKRVLKNVKQLCERLEVKTIPLAKDHSIEDYVISEEIFVESVLSTITLSLKAQERQIPQNLEVVVKDSWKQHKSSGGKNSGKWFKDICKKFGDEASKVALARTYAFTCRDKANLDPDDGRLSKALDLCGQIIEGLGVPKLRAKHSITSEEQTQPSVPPNTTSPMTSADPPLGPGVRRQNRRSTPIIRVHPRSSAAKCRLLKLLQSRRVQIPHPPSAQSLP